MDRFAARVVMIPSPRRQKRQGFYARSVRGCLEDQYCGVIEQPTNPDRLQPHRGPPAAARRRGERSPPKIVIHRQFAGREVQLPQCCSQ
jgi:hypothetical protein